MVIRSSSVCNVCVAGAVVRGPTVQMRGPMGVAMQASANQKQKLNDPGGGTFRYSKKKLLRQHTHIHTYHNSAFTHPVHDQLIYCLDYIYYLIKEESQILNKEI